MKFADYDIKCCLMDLPDDPWWKNKCDKCIEYCKTQGIYDIERIHCIHGKSWKVGPSEDNIYTVDQKPDEKFCIGQAKVSNFLSHVVILNSCLRMPENHFMLLEEDVQFIDGWKEKLDCVLKDIPKDFDILYVGSCCARDKNPKNIIGDLYYYPHIEENWRLSMPMCNHCWIVAKKCIKTLLDTNHDASNPWDVSMMLNTAKFLNTYAILPRLAHQSNTFLPE